MPRSAGRELAGELANDKRTVSGASDDDGAMISPVLVCGRRPPSGLTVRMRTTCQGGSSVVKKVRYLAGAVGMAPALAMLAQAGPAAAATAKPAVTTGKTVSLMAGRANIPAAGPTSCEAKSDSYTGYGRSDNMEFSIFYSKGKCVSQDYATLLHSQTGLYLRTRVWNDGDYWQAPYVAGSISPFGSITTWSEYVEHKGSNVCGAIVYENNLKVAYGAVCNKDT